MEAQQAEIETQKAQMKAQQTEVDTQLKILQMEKEEALARLRVLEQVMGESATSDWSIPAELQDPVERTSEYVLKHNVCNDTELSPVRLPNNTVLTLNTETTQLQMPEPFQVYNTSASMQQTASPLADNKVTSSVKPQPAKP